MIAALLSSFGPYIAALGAGLVALIVAYVKGLGDGKAKAQTDSLKRDVAARDDLLEMHREATAFERDAAAMSNEEAKGSAKRWAKD